MNQSNNITEINLDDIASNAVTVERASSDTKPIMMDVNIDSQLDDLDLLVDPNKSLQNSPKPSASSSNIDEKKVESNSIPVSEINLDNLGKAGENEKINFSMNVERPEKRNMNTSVPSSNSEVNFEQSFYVNPKSTQEDQIEKQELLFKLKRLESRGIPLSSHFSSSSRLSDIKEEYERIKKQRDLENSIKFQRKTMMAFTSGVEFLNSKFDPFDIKLDGWSESLHDNLSDYDDVFEELHEKYKTRANIAPELKLLMMLGGSAAMFHMTNSFFKSAMPSMDDVLKQNPDLARQFANAAVSSATQNNPGFGNVMGDMINETMNSRQARPEPMMPPPQPSRSMNENNYNPGNDVMSGPDDKDVERILSQIKEYREESTSNVKSNEIQMPIPVKDFSIANVTSSNVNTEGVVKKRRGRPPKNKPNTESFSLNI